MKAARIERLSALFGIGAGALLVSVPCASLWRRDGQAVVALLVAALRIAVVSCLRLRFVTQASALIAVPVLAAGVLIATQAPWETAYGVMGLAQAVAGVLGLADRRRREQA